MVEVGSVDPTYQQEMSKNQRYFEQGKVWHCPEYFWAMQFDFVCDQSWTEHRRLSDGCQSCARKNREFDAFWQVKQHLRSKAGAQSHADKAQLEAWEVDSANKWKPLRDEHWELCKVNPFFAWKSKQLNLAPVKEFTDEKRQEIDEAAREDADGGSIPR